MDTVRFYLKKKRGRKRPRFFADDVHIVPTTNYRAIFILRVMRCPRYSIV